MKKAQLSFEFMVLFGILLFIFMSVAYLFPGSMEKSSSTSQIAENLARDIKVKAITASLSETDFKSDIILPERINNVDIIVEIHAPDDDMIIIKDAYTGRALARAFLPDIDGPYTDDPGLRNLTIRKVNNVLTIGRTAYP